MCWPKFPKMSGEYYYPFSCGCNNQLLLFTCRRIIYWKNMGLNSIFMAINKKDKMNYLQCQRIITRSNKKKYKMCKLLAS